MDARRAGLTDIVGAAGVVDKPEMRNTFSLEHHLAAPLSPCFAVRPKNVNEVQQIVRWANETGTPLIPVSSGAPHFRGDTIPSVPEAVIVDLSSMKRILKIDRRNRLVLIEPGVIYGPLQQALREEGLRLISPLLPRKNKSVLAGLLEREPVMSPRYQWNLLEPLRSLEIVWGNGDVFFSGSGTFRGEEQADWDEGRVPLQGPGPGQLDYYKLVSAAQGSMGIVTWASVKCEVLPHAHKLFFVPSDRLEALIDFTYKLLKLRFGDELFIVNRTYLSYILPSSPTEIDVQREALPAWTVVVGISGGHMLADERIEAREEDIRDIAQQFGLKMVPALGSIAGSTLSDIIQQPSAQPYWKLRYKGGSQEIFFLTTLDKTPAFIDIVQATAQQEQYPAQDIGVYLQLVHQGVGCHCEFILPFDPHNPDDVKKTQALFYEASHALFRQGAYFSRPYGIWADMVYNADPKTTHVTQQMKDIFDPNRVMNPGKLCF
ncbi:MAG: FAD-binding oxidoreductase [Anaerolineae bacterium]|nr:FAD-binding oxidoreductase [Anaerolineae bacterium]